MRKVLLSTLFVACVLVLSSSTPSIADEANGVLVQERVVELPQDQNKWYISIVGSGQHYERLLRWFDENDNLKSLKVQVHYRKIAEGSAIYLERYSKNIKGLPTVRVQKADGTVVYEASGASIPFTAEGLYGAIASSCRNAQGLFPLLPWRRDCGPIIPWRRNIDRRLDSCPCPNPQPEPPAPDPEPPVYVGPPEVPDDSSSSLTVVFAILATILGGVIGLVVQWKETYSQQ